METSEVQKAITGRSKTAGLSQTELKTKQGRTSGPQKQVSTPSAVGSTNECAEFTR